MQLALDRGAVYRGALGSADVAMSGEPESFDLDAAWFRRAQGDLGAFMEALAARLEGALATLLAATIAGFAPASALAAPSNGLSANEVRSLPPREVVRRALDLYSRDIVEVHIPENRSAFGGLFRKYLYALMMAKRPHSAGEPGLCQADVITLHFDPIAKASPRDADDGADAPSRPTGMDLQTRYWVVDSTSPLPDGWNDAYGAQLDARCAKLSKAWTFFPARNVTTAWVAARAIELVLPTVTSSDPAAAKFMRMEYLTDIASTRCDGDPTGDLSGDGPGLHCQTLTFGSDDGGKVDYHVVTLKIRLQLDRRPNGGDAITVLDQSWTQPTLGSSE